MYVASALPFVYSSMAGLDLSHSHLSVLPDDLSNLTLLVEFNLSSNLFQLVPSVLMQMASLKKIDISRHKTMLIMMNCV